MWSQMHPALKALSAVLAVVGLLAVIAGVMYLAMPAHSLPSFFPAHTKLVHDKLHATKHGYAALVLGVVLIVAAVAVPSTVRRSRAVG